MFMATLTKEIADDGLNPEARMMACIIFKNFILNRSKDAQFEGFWF